MLGSTAMLQNPAELQVLLHVACLGAGGSGRGSGGDRGRGRGKGGGKGRGRQTAAHLADVELAQEAPQVVDAAARRGGEVLPARPPHHRPRLPHNLSQQRRVARPHVLRPRGRAVRQRSALQSLRRTAIDALEHMSLCIDSRRRREAGGGSGAAVGLPWTESGGRDR